MLNAVIAGCIVVAIGEGSILAFERIYLGQNSIEDLDWVKKLMEEQMGQTLIERITVAMKNLPAKPSKDDITAFVLNVFQQTQKGNGGMKQIGSGE